MANIARRSSLLTVMLCVFVAASQEPLSNDSVIKMVKAGISDDIIVTMVKGQPAKYTLTPDGVISLKASGVSDKVLAAMVERSSEPVTPGGTTASGATKNPEITDASVQDDAAAAVDANQKSAGGKWLFSEGSNKMTGGTRSFFSIKSDVAISDAALKDKAMFVIVCVGAGKSASWVQSQLILPVLLSSDTKFHSTIGNIPQLMVSLRADDKLHIHFWNSLSHPRGGGLLTADRGATKEVIGAALTRIEFRDYYRRDLVAAFASAGLDRQMLTNACGNSLR
jgi:hypothetical protein